MTYLYAGVLPLGSSQLEQRAAASAGDLSWKTLEEWRKRKEADENVLHLTIARNHVGKELKEETVTTLYRAKEKLNADNIEKQLQDFRVMFGGGGHVENPYAESVLRAFDDERVFGIRPPHADVVGMPLPKDLEPSESLSRWMSRLWVAYGLSFQRDELAGHMYPSQVPKGKPISKRIEIDSIRKEDV